MINNKLLLASSSPRRKKILEDNGYNPIVISSYGEKDISGKIYTKKLLIECAKLKAIESYKIYKNNYMKNIIIVSADTVVVNDGVIYGKPKNRDDAINMLKSLSAKTHIVCTAICIGFYKNDLSSFTNNDKNVEIEILNNNENMIFISDNEETKVTFKNITEKEIENYIDEKKPFDKAGAYGIQDEGFAFVKEIEGNIDNVIGFPIKKFESLLLKMAD